MIILIFSFFAIDKKYYKRLLMWRVIGAIVMRFVFIFGAFLVYTGISIFINKDKDEKIKTIRSVFTLLPNQRYNEYV